VACGTAARKRADQDPYGTGCCLTHFLRIRPPGGSRVSGFDDFVILPLPEFAGPPGEIVKTWHHSPRANKTSHPALSDHDHLLSADIDKLKPTDCKAELLFDRFKPPYR
jgi:hypothetical protein